MTDYSRFRVQQLTPACGAELLDCDLANFDDTLIEEVKDALLRFRVVFFRDQDLSQEAHIAFAAEFGDLEIHPATPKDQANPEVLRIAHGAKSRGSENMWHSDVTWREAPSLGSILRAVELPPVGGDTLFANMVMAYERLSDELKEKIENLSASHDIARVFARRLGKKAEELHDKYPPMVYPVVRTHPDTKERLIYVNGAFTDHIVDMDPEESKQLLDTLYKTAWNPEVQCRFNWRPGSMAFWDNRACQHFAASDYFPQVRVMERVTIAGDRPYFDAAA